MRCESRATLIARGPIIDRPFHPGSGLLLPPSSDATPRGRSRGREDGASSHLTARPPARVADTIKADGDLAESPLIPATDISTMAITGEMNALYYSAVSAERRWMRARS